MALLLLFNAVTLGAYAIGEVPEEAADDLSSAASFETGETEEAEEWVTLGKEKEPLHSAFWKEGDLSGDELASAVLSPQTLPAFLTSEKAEERGHVKRLYEQQPNSDTVIFQNRDGSKTLYCPVGSLSDVLTQPESGAKDRAEIAALERVVQKKFDLKPEQIGAVYTEDGMAVVAYSEIGGDYYINSYGSARFLNCGGVRANTTTGTTAGMGMRPFLSFNLKVQAKIRAITISIPMPIPIYIFSIPVLPLSNRSHIPHRACRRIWHAGCWWRTAVCTAS